MKPNSHAAHGRVAALDELRGVAILAVIASHAGLVFGPELEAARALTVPALGVGVDLFFVISGLMVSENVLRLQQEAQGFFWRGACAFWGRRILRIGPPAWIVLCLIACFRAAGIPLGATYADLGAAAGFYANFHWAPCFGGEVGCGALLAASHFWSLANEMQFYLAAPFLIALKPRWTALICCAVLVAGAFCERRWGGFWWTFRADGLVIGMLLSLGAARASWLPRIGAATASFLLLIASILARILEALASGFALTAVATIFGFVVASAVASEGRSQKANMLQRIGELSFSIYLVHLPIMAGIKETFDRHAIPAIALLISIASIFLCALLLERWITSPAQGFGRRFSAWACGRNRLGRQPARVGG